jgi:hypothetical protein
VACGDVQFTNTAGVAPPAVIGTPGDAPSPLQPPDTKLPAATGDDTDGLVPNAEPPADDPVLSQLDELIVATIPADLPAYDRKDWPHWDDDDKDCQNTRAEVLIVESYATVSFKAGKACTVDAGEWFDPYTAQTFYRASELDIDHMIPLKNAHLSGAHTWTREQRRAFANDMQHPEHLIAVDAGANRSKGARGPEAWKPPAEDHWCDYATHWVQIKWRWQLSVTPAEYATLAHMIETC